MGKNEEEEAKIAKTKAKETADKKQKAEALEDKSKLEAKKAKEQQAKDDAKEAAAAAEKAKEEEADLKKNKKLQEQRKKALENKEKSIAEKAKQQEAAGEKAKKKAIAGAAKEKEALEQLEAAKAAAVAIEEKKAKELEEALEQKRAYDKKMEENALKDLAQKVQIDVATLHQQAKKTSQRLEDESSKKVSELTIKMKMVDGIEYKKLKASQQAYADAKAVHTREVSSKSSLKKTAGDITSIKSSLSEM